MYDIVAQINDDAQTTTGEFFTKIKLRHVNIVILVFNQNLLINIINT